MIDQIVNEMIIASKLLKTNQVSTIASDLGYQPILIMNALFNGERSGKWVYVKKKDLIKISEDVEVDALAVTDALAESREMVEEFIANENSIEVDMTFDELRSFIPMLPELHLQIALHTSKLLDSYQIADPKDKESVYTFYSLKENAGHMWGKKQFDASKSLASKSAKKAARKAAKKGE